MGRPERSNTKGVVYLIEFPNGKKYVGITTTSFEERKKSHLSHRNTSQLPVHQALKKFFGSESWQVIAEAESWSELANIEVQMIEFHQSHTSKNGYNLTLGGDGTVGYTHTQEQRKKNSNAKIDYFSKSQNRIKQSKASIIAHYKNPEQAKKHAIFQRKKFENENERKKIADGMRNFLSDEENLINHSITRGAKVFLVRTIDGDNVGEWLTQHQCSRDLNLQVSKINNCLHGKRKSHGGYTFHYIHNETT